MLRELIEGVQIDEKFYKYANNHNTNVNVTYKNGEIIEKEQEWLLDNDDNFREYFVGSRFYYD